MTPDFQQFTNANRGELVSLMRQLYEHSGMSWSEPVAQRACEELLRSPDKGGAWMVRVQNETAGYFVLTLAFSLEFGGVFGLLDELYVRPEWRGKGIGTAALRFAERQCRELGGSALRLETGTENTHAVRFYERHGLSREERYLMTKRLP